MTVPQEKARDLRKYDTSTLIRMLAEARREYFNLRFQQATRQLDNPARIKQVRKRIARILTILRERELAEEAVAAEEGG